MRRLIFFTLCMLVFSIAKGQVRERINFDRDWKFSLGHAGDATKDFNYSIAPIFSKSGKAETTAIDPKFNDAQWQRLDLPHDWVVALPFVEADNFDVMAHGYKPVGGLYPENSIGWYRKTFQVAAADSGKRFSFTFDGVFRNSKVWINGFYLGTNESGYVGFTYDITDYLNFHGNNVVVVRADATQYEGWFYEGAGIYRHVWLNKHESLSFVDNSVFVQASLNGKAAEVNVTAQIENKTLAPIQTTTTFVVADRNGKTLSRSKEIVKVIDPGATAELSGDIMTLDEPILWSLENPYLYKLIAVTTAYGKPSDERMVRFGVRAVEVTPDRGLLLNGLPVKIQGVNCHQDHAGVGSALPDYLQYYRVKLLKNMGVNAYRTSHHAPTPELLDACDSLGLLVLDEARLLNSSKEYIDQFARLVQRDRNHPSVFLWSIGNEEGYAQANSYGKRIATSMIQLQTSLDPTRTSTYAADLGNVFNGVNEVIPVRGFNYREKFVVPYHHDHPQQPVVGTEMGSTVTTRGIYSTDSTMGYLPDQDITAPWWASTAEAWWPIAAENKWFMGGFIWTGFDYRGEPTPFKWPNVNSHFGVMDLCGFPKNIYYYYKSWWHTDDVIHISPHWNWPGKEGKNIDVWVNSNADNVELFLNGKSLGKKAMPRNSHLQWSVKYEKGMLSAIGYRNGRKISAKVETTDLPFRIVLHPDRTQIKADGKDATVINVVVVDKKGREVPNANIPVTFSVSGQGKLMGVGNGDPSSHESDLLPQRKLFNGKCQLIVQSSDTSGQIVVEAKSGTLEKASVNIQTLSPLIVKVSAR